MGDPDVRFWFDPVCPFAWMTSRWVHLVADQRDYDVEWRLISLRLLNRKVDYDAQFPPEYEAGHTAGLRLLRVLARAREEHGAQVLGGLYDAMGARIWDTATPPKGGAAVEVAAPALAEVGLPAELATALDDDAWDDVVLAEPRRRWPSPAATSAPRSCTSRRPTVPPSSAP